MIKENALLSKNIFLLKSQGKKDISKLVKRQVIDKNGHRRTVWVRLEEVEEKNQKLPPQIKEYLKWIEEGKNLDELYRKELPKLKDEYVEVLLKKAIEVGNKQQYSLILPNLFRVTETKNRDILIKNFINKIVGTNTSVNRLYQILYHIKEEKTLIEMTETLLDRFPASANEIFEFIFPKIKNQEKLIQLIESQIKENKNSLPYIEFALQTIQNEEVLTELTLKAMDEISKNSDHDFWALYSTIFGKIKDEKLLGKLIISAIEKEEYVIDVFDRFLPTIKNKKLFNSIVDAMLKSYSKGSTPQKDYSLNKLTESQLFSIEKIKDFQTKDWSLKNRLELRRHNPSYESLSYIYSQYKDKKLVTIKELFDSGYQGLYIQNEQEFKKNKILINSPQGKVLDIRKLEEYVNTNKDIKELEENKFNFSTIKTWRGAQSISQKDFSSVQKVISIQLESMPIDTRKKELFKKVFGLSKISGHPVLNTTIGWMRLSDIKEKNGNKSLVIDEVQSDLIDEQTFKSLIEGNHITQEEVDEIKNEFKDWQDILYSKVLQIAKNNGYEKIYLHTASTLQQKGGTSSNTRYKELYEKFAKTNGFVKKNIDELDLNVKGEMWVRDVNPFSKSKRFLIKKVLLKSIGSK